jgi:hypothetical protein
MNVIPKGTTDTINASVTLAMARYGPQGTPSPPPASETGNLLAILKAEGKSGDLSS